MSKPTKAEKSLLAQLDKIRTKARALQEKRETKELQTLVGTHWRFWSSYSCPESETDYWWTYKKLYKSDRMVFCFEFQVDKDGKATVEKTIGCTPSAGWKPISSNQFWDAWDATKNRISQMAAEASKV